MAALYSERCAIVCFSSTCPMIERKALGSGSFHCCLCSTGIRESWRLCLTGMDDFVARPSAWVLALCGAGLSSLSKGSLPWKRNCQHRLQEVLAFLQLSARFCEWLLGCVHEFLLVYFCGELWTLVGGSVAVLLPALNLGAFVHGSTRADLQA